MKIDSRDIERLLKDSDDAAFTYEDELSLLKTTLRYMLGGMTYGEAMAAACGLLGNAIHND